MRKPDLERPHPIPFIGGTQKIYRFPNGYGASVINSHFCYGGDRGLYELAVLGFNSSDITDLYVIYDAPIDSPQGHLTEEDVDGLLGQIEKF